MLVQDVSHLYNDSGDCAQQLSELTLVPLAPGRATFTWEEALAAIDRGASGRVPAPVGALSIESPVRRLHGEAFSFDAMREIGAEARRRVIGLHLDGARLFVQCAYFDRSPAEYSALFDTVYVSLWKCSTPAAAPSSRGRRLCWRTCTQVCRMFGGARLSAWPYAAVARHYAEGFLDRLATAVKRSEELIEWFHRHPENFTVQRVTNGTSLFRLKPKTPHLPTFREKLSKRGILLPEPDGDGFWLKVNESLASVSSDSLAVAFQSAS